MRRDGSDTSETSRAAPFVGRAAEMSALMRSLERALASRGQVAVLAGDAGMGKTRTAQELANIAEARGVQVLWGRCSEEPGAPPYWPWTQAIRAYAASCSDDQLRDAIGPGAEFVVGIAPDLGARLDTMRPAVQAGDQSQRRFMQFDALARFWLRAARTRALLLVLDNLHGADPTSLRLLVFLAEELADSKLFVLGSYRESEVTRGHPLSDALADLARTSNFTRLALGGLDRDATERYVAEVLDSTPDEALVDQLHQRTDGVPLFLVETLRLLRSPRGAGATPLQELSQRQIPSTIREVIGRRLNRLSPACARLLDFAAVLGRAFDGELLAALDPATSEETLFSALEEAQAVHLIVPLAAVHSYQFSHALIRETLYDELLPARRARLHLQIGALLEINHTESVEAHLPQLAYHFGAALPGGSPDKALDYARRAAERAIALLAFEEAARLYGLALALQQQHFAHDRVARCSLLIAMGLAQHRAGLTAASLATYLAAAVQARELHGAVELSAAALGYEDLNSQLHCASGRAAFFSHAALGYEDAGWRGEHSGEVATSLLEEALKLVPESDTVLRARLEAALCREFVYTRRPQHFDAAYQRALALARRLGDPLVLFKVLAAMAPARIWPAYLDARRRAAQEAQALTDGIGRPDWFLGEIAYFHFADLIEAGEIAAARAMHLRYAPVTEAMHEPFMQTMALSAQVLLAIHDGRWAEAEALAEKTLESGRRGVIAAHAQGVYGVQMFSIRRHQGRLGEVLPVIRHIVASNPEARTWQPGLALLYAELGMRDEARQVFDKVAKDHFAAVLQDVQAVTEATYLSEVCAWLGDAEHAPVLYRALLPFAGRTLVGGTTVVCHGSTDRYLGALASAMKQHETARRHFETALAIDAKNDGKPTLARTQLAFAIHLLNEPGAGPPETGRVRSRRGGAQRQGCTNERDAERARALLGEALLIASGFGMAALERRCRELLDAQPAARASLPDGLSQREVEVLRLIAAGRSNKEIGDTMFISQYTVANHVRHILGKIGAANRTEAAAYAIRHRLAQP